MTLRVPCFRRLSKPFPILDYSWGIDHIQTHVALDSFIDSRINVFPSKAAL